MGNKPITDVKANTSIKCTCFTKPEADEIISHANLGDLFVLKDSDDNEIKYKYKKKVRKGHVYTKK